MLVDEFAQLSAAFNSQRPLCNLSVRGIRTWFEIYAYARLLTVSDAARYRLNVLELNVERTRLFVTRDHRYI